ncbi:MAG: hypothetical protein ACE5KI_00825 [Dehalococcoidia bacterium]
MGTQFWILAQAQVLDLLFSEFPAQDPLAASRKHWSDSLERVANRQSKDVFPLTEEIAATFVSQVIRSAAKTCLPIREGMSRWGGLVLHWAPFYPNPQVALRGLRRRQTWVKGGQRALELASLDMPYHSKMASARGIGWSILRAGLPVLGRKAVSNAIGALPGSKSLPEVVFIDGTLLFQEPRSYLRMAPHLLRDSLTLFPAPLMAAALVSGAFVQGKTIEGFWSGLVEEDTASKVSPLRRSLNRLSEALGLQRPADREGEAQTLGAVAAAKYLQGAIGLAEGVEGLLGLRRRPNGSRSGGLDAS